MNKLSTNRRTISKMISVKIEDIMGKIPFIYEVKENRYIIGNYVFAPCMSQFACDYFERYRMEIARVGRETLQQETFQCCSVDYKDLIYVFRKVKAYANIDVSNDAKGETRKKTKEFLASLNEQEKQNLLDQLEDFVAVFRLQNK